MSFRGWQLLVPLLISPVFAEETTTQNLIDDYGWTPSGGLLNHYNHHHTDWTGGSVSQSIDLSAYEGQLSYNYSTSVYGCGNTIGGDCSSGVTDTFTVTLTLDTGEQFVNTFAVGNQWEDIDITYTPTEDASLATLELYGVDNGYWAGWYGPVFYSGSFTVTFDPTLTEVIIPAANPELQSVLPADPTTDPSMAMPEVTVEIAPVAQVETPAPQPQPQQTAQAQPTATAPKSKTEVKVKTRTGTLLTTLDTAKASAATIGDAFGDPNSPVAQAVMIAVMASNGADLTEAKLVQPEIPKPPRMRDRNLESRFWLDSLRSEARFQKHMVDKQWQK